MPLGIFSMPKTRTVSYCAGPDRRRPQHERGAAAGASRLDVDDRACRSGRGAPSTLWPDATPP